MCVDMYLFIMYADMYVGMYVGIYFNIMTCRLTGMFADRCEC